MRPEPASAPPPTHTQETQQTPQTQPLLLQDPLILNRDPDRDRLLTSLQQGRTVPVDSHPAASALRKVVDVRNDLGVKPVGEMTCYAGRGDAAPAGRPVIEGCVQDVTYPTAASVRGFDETTLFRPDSAFQNWSGSNGRTAPRREKGQIVSTWYFLLPVKTPRLPPQDVPTKGVLK